MLTWRSIGRKFRSPESWTSFSQVSRHWRSTALGAPELWTNISLSYPRWAQEMLIRSKKAKVTIQCGLSFQTSIPKIIETVRSMRSCLYEMNRVEKIDITITPRLILQIFRGLPKSAPQLHTLCIRNHSFHYAETEFSIDENFLYDTERLQRVELISVGILSS